jgi:hypothetical protein
MSILFVASTLGVLLVVALPGIFALAKLRAGR